MIATNPRTPRFRPFALLILAGAIAGCGQAGAKDRNEAQDVLRSALDAWKEGKTIAAVQEEGITISDSQWQDGLKLRRYEIGTDLRPAGFDLNCPVDLWLEDPQGRSIQEKAMFTVSTHPARTVVRAPFDRPLEPLKTKGARR